VTLAKKPVNPVASLVGVAIESVPDFDFGPSAAIDRCRARLANGRVREHPSVG
jgi:hypothetical protein